MQTKPSNRQAPTGFTALELLCIIGIIALLVALLMPSLSRVKKISTRVVCGTNLKGLGAAMAVYANDYEDKYPQLPGCGPWSKRLGFDYTMQRPDFAPGGAESDVPRTVSASWYLLVREADVSPKSFVCPEGGQVPFGGRYDYTYDRDITELWDFGPDPWTHVSYAYHLPYGSFPADGSRGVAFAVAADTSPWFANGDVRPPGPRGQPPQLLDLNASAVSSLSYGKTPSLDNSPNHYLRGQNVAYADGHASFETATDVGIRRDGIYTYWPHETPTDDEKRIGQNPTARDPDNDAKDPEDSFLVM
ncbi:MAG TPA: type II secretion system protein [Anaerohalosphaeraceae bacterium]|nr:type II secretion system protein [Anaerohalosphaeraceae bacterium]HRT51433.1 type II secretion system protein [Anaerohalosphaeraceae bacterium]HRT87496.1 type II secretion system protein [Anaerohalosphaeraceae bacterium]